MQLDKEKFDCLYRYLILVAQNKRVVMYHELESVFRLSHKLVGLYAGAIGDFCLEQNLPLLNSLIVSAQECQPSDGFANYLEKSGMDSWGDCLVKCWQEYHVTTTQVQKRGNYQGITDLIDDSKVLSSIFTK
ncbi:MULTISPECIES: hypothetical protein [Neisseria]|jgi:hypothetical protein|uniref:hypothetical protein n=1 Tax=Neisseria TaxID=482 RepID=UPI0005D419F9|nr:MULTISPECIES: hypothetical protein [Neisseria]KJJ19844.1 hypothetical protein HMPREF3156_00623 [Neisseria sp. HMSC06F02]OFJ84057.1 hypothetical protein HMPREF2844_03140 [Neisseria sp. HMSC072F04]OFS01495.1 hypothetical protein HMPREF2954_07400 [Neisseria sp. HMSC067H09]OHR46466.1 hypothetical protein HMPREF3025_09975 [Neisseria sp. HMSC070E12]OFO39246.1 hypothetical protein HMPREF3050_12260 [Neisseria sp. HMSC065D04]